MATHETRFLTVRSRVQAFVPRGTPMSAVDFCPTGRADRSARSSDSETCGSPPEVCSTAFNAQSPYLHPSFLKDVDFAVTGQLVRRHRPHIRFLSFGSRFCSTPPSVPPRDHALALRSPCTSIMLRRRLTPPRNQRCAVSQDWQCQFRLYAPCQCMRLCGRQRRKSEQFPVMLLSIFALSRHPPPGYD
jgi:hypothetical protein